MSFVVLPSFIRATISIWRGVKLKLRQVVEEWGENFLEIRLDEVNRDLL